MKNKIFLKKWIICGLVAAVLVYAPSRVIFADEATEEQTEAAQETVESVAEEVLPETLPEEETAPAEEGTSAEEALLTEESPLMDVPAMTEDAVPAEESAPTEESATMEEPAPAEMLSEEEPGADALSEIPEEAVPEAVCDAAPEADALLAETPAAETVFAEQEIEATVYVDEDCEEIWEDVKLRVKGLLPENATVTAYPVLAGVEGEETFAAYEIVIRDAMGNEIHSEAGDGATITVTIRDEALAARLACAPKARAWHKEEDDSVTDVAFELLSDAEIRFMADIF